GEFALIGLQRAVGLILQLLGRGQVARDRVLTRLEQPADARQRNSRDDQIKRDERNQERDQLRSKGLLLERRKGILVTAFCFGAGCRAPGVTMTFSHGLLLSGRQGPGADPLTGLVWLRAERTAAAARSAARRCRALRSRRNRRSG